MDTIAVCGWVGGCGIRSVLWSYSGYFQLFCRIDVQRGEHNDAEDDDHDGDGQLT